MKTPANFLRSGQRHWKRVILIPTLLGALAGFLTSYLFLPKYSSQSLVSVQLPMGDAWGPLIVHGYKQQLTNLRDRALADNQLLPLVEPTGLAKPGEDRKLIEQIRQNTTLKPVFKGSSENVEAVPLSQVVGFYVIYTDSSPKRAQDICKWVTSTLLEEERAQRRKNREDTMEFLRAQVEDAKSNLRNLHAQLAKWTNDRAGRTSEDQRSRQRLTHDYETAQNSYAALLAKVRQSQTASEAESKSESELESGQLRVLSPASLPVAPDFPNRLLFAGAGLGMGLAAGISLLWVQSFVRTN